MAKLNIPIPKELAHLPIDERGYPIPYFAAIVDGKHDFRLLDARKQQRATEGKLCAVCGRKLPKDFCYFISGVLGLTNQVSTDPAMHRTCAEFSLRACPHMYFQKAERRDTNVDITEVSEGLMTMNKPKELFLIKARSNFKRIIKEGHPLISYNYVSCEKYSYENGLLTKAADDTITVSASEAHTTALLSQLRKAHQNPLGGR